MVSRRVPSLSKSIVLAISFLTLGAGADAPGNSLHAEECLSAPDSPSPQGTHWRYRLDWPTQRKCWYLGAPARSLRRAAAAAPATPVLFGRRHSVDVPPKSVDPADAASPSSHVDMLPIDPPTSEGITARGGRLLQQSVPEDISAPGPIGTPVPASKHVVAEWQRGGRTGSCSYDVARSRAYGCSGSGPKSHCHPNRYTCGFSVLRCEDNPQRGKLYGVNTCHSRTRTSGVVRRGKKWRSASRIDDRRSARARRSTPA
jgi:hypothetical protein